MSGSLEGKKALVTGASGGIGRAIALELTKEGAEVCIHHQQDNTAEAQAVAHEITLSGGMTSMVSGDLEFADQAISIGEEAWKKLGRVDILINNAGITIRNHFLDYTLEEIDRVTHVNFRGTLLLTQTVARKMISAGVAGSITTITSVNGVRPGIGLSVYGASKGAVEVVMQGAAMELAPHNIKVNTIAAGAIETAMTASVIQDPQLKGKVDEGIPMTRFGKPEEVAKVVVALLISGSYMTGASITVDGGLLLMRGYGKPEKYLK
jgi:glucose 1-dehydrogenase